MNFIFSLARRPSFTKNHLGNCFRNKRQRPPSMPKGQNVRQIAQAAGVSIATVSRVLNHAPGVSGKVRQAVLTAANRSGYVPKVGRRSISNVALVYTDVPTLESPFDAALVSGIYEGLERLGYDLMVLDAHRSRQAGEAFSRMFLRKGVKGALVRTTARSRNLCREIFKEDFPAVVVGYRFEGSPINCVYSDSREASGKAVEHLIALGHRRIAACSHVVEDSDHTDRLKAYRAALEAHRIQFDESLVIRVPASRDGGVQLVRRLATMPRRPTALFLTDPLLSVGVLSEARRIGLRIPGDLSLAGFDDADLRYALAPQLTAVCQDARTLGREAAAWLGRILSGRPGTVEHAGVLALPCWLEVHESTGAAPAEAAAALPSSIHQHPNPIDL